jgi:DNA repair exonuclease SbcCD nuclease subunit
MKILIFSDIHIHPHKKSSDRLDDCLKVLDWVFEIAKSRDISNIVFLGDLFHDRQRIDVLTYQKTFEVMERRLSERNLDLRLLLGNHDLWHNDRLDVSSVNPLRSIKGITVVDKPCVQEISNGSEDVYFAFLPYTHNPIEDINDLEKDWKSAPQGRKKILGAHLSVDGAVWNTRFNTTSEVAVEHDGDMTRVGPDIFKRWDRVFLGHYHAAQRLDDVVEYVGSPLQLSFGEAFQEKNVIIYDTKEDSSEYIKNDFSPKHFIIGEDEIDKYPLEGNFVRVEVEDITSKAMSDMRQILVENSKVSTLEIKQSRRKEEHVISDAKSILQKEDEMLQRYIDQAAPEDLDKQVLLNIGMKICKGSDIT